MLRGCALLWPESAFGVLSRRGKLRLSRLLVKGWLRKFPLGARPECELDVTFVSWDAKRMNLEQWLEQYRRDHTHPINRATHAVGIPMIVIALPAILLSPWLAAGLFVLGWVLQFIGHAFEGKAPSFFRNPRFLLIGPLWWFKKLRR